MGIPFLQVTPLRVRNVLAAVVAEGVGVFGVFLVEDHVPLERADLPGFPQIPRKEPEGRVGAQRASGTSSETSSAKAGSNFCLKAKGSSALR